MEFLLLRGEIFSKGSIHCMNQRKIGVSYRLLRPLGLMLRPLGLNGPAHDGRPRLGTRSPVARHAVTDGADRSIRGYCRRS